MGRALLVGVMLAALTTLSGLSYASPPDPTWIPGIYDDADFDDVIALVDSISALVGPVDPAALHLPVPPTAAPAPPPERAHVSRSAATLHARAPPAA